MKIVQQYIVEHKAEVRLFCISFFVHLFVSVFLFHQFGHKVLFFQNEDAYSYTQVADSIVAGSGFARAGVPSAVRTPVYPLLLTIPPLLRLPFTWTILIFQNLAASLAGVLLYRLGRLWFSDRVGTIAGYIYVLEPYMLMTANLAITETVFNTVMLASVYYFSVWLKSRANRRALIAAGLLWGITTLTRPVGLYAPVIFILLIALVTLPKKLYREFLLATGLFLLFFFVVLAPWLGRQYLQYERLKITNGDAEMLYDKVAPIVVSDQEGISYDAATLKLKDKLRQQGNNYQEEDTRNNFKYYDYMMTETKALITAHPGVVIKFYAISLIPALLGSGYEYMLEDIWHLPRLATRVSYTQLLAHNDWAKFWRAVTTIDIFQIVHFASALMWVGAYLLIGWSLSAKVTWRRDWLPLVFFLLLAAYFVFFSLGPQAHARYRMPSFPFWFLLLSYAIQSYYEKGKKII